MNDLRRDVLPLGAQLQRRGPGVDRLDVSTEKDSQRTQSSDRGLERTRLAFGGDGDDVGGQAHDVQIDQRGSGRLRIRGQPLLDQGRLDRWRDPFQRRDRAIRQFARRHRDEIDVRRDARHRSGAGDSRTPRSGRRRRAGPRERRRAGRSPLLESRTRRRERLLRDAQFEDRQLRPVTAEPLLQERSPLASDRPDPSEG